MESGTAAAIIAGIAIAVIVAAVIAIVLISNSKKRSQITETVTSSINTGSIPTPVPRPVSEPVRIGEIVCPFCYETFNSNEVRFKINQGGILQYVSANINNKETVSFCEKNNYMARTIYKNTVPVRMEFLKIGTNTVAHSTTMRVCKNPKCNEMLSPNAGKYTADNGLFLLGMKGTGKTVFITSVIHSINDIMARYQCSFRAYNGGVDKDYHENYERVMFEEKRLPEATVHEATLTYEIENIHSHKVVGITFSDIKGEIAADLEELNKEAINNVMRHSNYFMLMVDMTNEDTIIDNKRIIDEVLVQNAGDPDKYLAIVLTKSDMLAKSVISDPSERIFERSVTNVSDIYKSVCNLRTEAEEYNRQRININNGIRNYFIERQGNYGQLIMSAENVFGRNVGYFAVSALGSSPKADGTLNDIHPLRVEEPILWLLEKSGVLSV